MLQCKKCFSLRGLQSVEGLELFSCGRFKATVSGRSFCSASKANLTTKKTTTVTTFDLTLERRECIGTRQLSTSVQLMSPVGGEPAAGGWCHGLMEEDSPDRQREEFGKYGGYWSAPPQFRCTDSP